MRMRLRSNLLVKLGQVMGKPIVFRPSSSRLPTGVAPAAYPAIGGFRMVRQTSPPRKFVTSPRRFPVSTSGWSLLRAEGADLLHLRPTSATMVRDPAQVALRQPLPLDSSSSSPVLTMTTRSQNSRAFLNGSPGEQGGQAACLGATSAEIKRSGNRLRLSKSLFQRPRDVAPSSGYVGDR